MWCMKWISISFCDCRLSVLQLAIDSAVYLLDVLTLSELLADDDWRCLVENVFCNESISVVGKFLLLLDSKVYFGMCAENLSF